MESAMVAVVVDTAEPVGIVAGVMVVAKLAVDHTGYRIEYHSLLELYSEDTEIVVAPKHLLKELAQRTPRNLTGSTPDYPLPYLAFLDGVNVTHDSGYFV